ncbi:hypothetical protein [Yinghuangia seranimata]|uniref:hypothetical protein n=1 Tax=Yinghuangia seranimata TaxID=408067 RepID=UPI00248B7279|nr:hypothetical protein [Yinghuangia seranimata]MDI2129071.1 hypothetical protein [Yinghuangia seranimata]
MVRARAGAVVAADLDRGGRGEACRVEGFGGAVEAGVQGRAGQGEFGRFGAQAL